MFWKKRRKGKIALSAPGPSPWYLRVPWATIKNEQGEWRWKSYDDSKLSGITRLIAPNGVSVLFLEFHCYVLPLAQSQILVWNETGRNANGNNESPRIVFTILDVSALRGFPNHEEAAAQLREKKRHLLFSGESVAVFEFNSAVSEGVHPITAPPEFQRLMEILVLADYGPAEPASSHSDRMYRAIFAFRFNMNQVEVLPQKWFNEGNYDFGYQWITRVERNQQTGRIVGEGIRLGNFQLDSSSTRIEKWLEKDVFYHPEGE